MMRKNNDLVFACKKCGHLLFLTNGLDLKGVQIMLKLANDCHNCGEEAQDLWIFSGTGNYEEEYGDDAHSSLYDMKKDWLKTYKDYKAKKKKKIDAVCGYVQVATDRELDKIMKLIIKMNE